MITFFLYNVACTPPFVVVITSKQIFITRRSLNGGANARPPVGRPKNCRDLSNRVQLVQRVQSVKSVGALGEISQCERARRGAEDDSAEHINVAK